ncbi:hypothetical protein BT93_B3156 [Corymbia citriodora subsp. variegata]|nr:hypothetical protein BT93_B3156 [Corymbia citriodora subsp. variegata]
MNHRSLERYVIVGFISRFIRVDSENRMFHHATAPFLSSPLPLDAREIYPIQDICTSISNFTYTSVKISEMKTKIRMNKKKIS